MATFSMKKGDTSPSLLYSLFPLSIDLTDASVVFNMKRVDGDMKVTRGAAVVATATGTPAVRYDWDSADTDTSGTYLFEFEVTYSSGAIETFRNDGFDRVVILDDLG